MAIFNKIVENNKIKSYLVFTKKINKFNSNIIMCSPYCCEKKKQNSFKHYSN